MKEFMYVFQISKLITFEVNFYTLGTNSAPYFSTSANKFCRSKKQQSLSITRTLQRVRLYPR